MSAPGLPPDTSNMVGTFLILYLLQWGLLGVLSVQVYIYYLAFLNDPLARKILVHAVYVAELVQTILFSQMAFKEFAAGFGSFEAFNKVGSFWFAIPVLSSTVAFAVQIFYAHKIKLLAKSNFVPAAVVLFALIQLGGGIGAGVFTRRFRGPSEAMTHSGVIWIAGSAVCDIIIAVFMTYYLSQSKTTWKPTQRIVQRLIFLFIGSGTLTATTAIITLVLLMLPGHPLYYAITGGILGKMYSNTMMVILNNRIVLQVEDESIMLNEHVSSSTLLFNPGISQRPAFSTSHSGILVTHKQWTIPLDVYKMQHDTKELEADSDNAYTTAKSEVACVE